MPSLVIPTAPPRVATTRLHHEPFTSPPLPPPPCFVSALSTADTTGQTSCQVRLLPFDHHALLARESSAHTQGRQDTTEREVRAPTCTLCSSVPLQRRVGPWFIVPGQLVVCSTKKVETEKENRPHLDLTCLLPAEQAALLLDIAVCRIGFACPGSGDRQVCSRPSTIFPRSPRNSPVLRASVLEVAG